MIKTPVHSPTSSPTQSRRNSEEIFRESDPANKSKSVTTVITPDETRTDYWVRHTVGRVSCVGQTIVYGLGVLFQTGKIIIKAPVSLFAEGAKNLFVTELFDDFAFVGMKKDARHLHHLFNKKFIDVASWDNLLPPVGYCSLWDAFISTANVVAFGENEVDVLEKKEKIRIRKIKRVRNAVFLCIQRLKDLNAVDVEGLFRVPGNSEQIAELIVDFKLNKNGDLFLNNASENENVIAGTLKQILRDMDYGLLDSVKDKLLHIDETKDIAPQLKDVIDEIADKRERDFEDADRILG